MREALDVYWGDDDAPLGQVVREEDKTTFRYARGLSRERRISHSLPLDDGAAEHPITFFDNLLPDGVQRERLARRLGVSDASTFALLKAVGGDCAGALSLVEEGAQRSAGHHENRILDRPLIEKMTRAGVVPTALAEGLRLSLAGAQDKLPVLFEDGQLVLPTGASVSTHILKLAGGEFRGVCSNEHFMLSLARTVGLPAVEARLVRLHGVEALLVARFDRSAGHRLHQEDFCQAQGTPPWRKYEGDGGPSLVDAIRLLDEAGTDPGDIFQLVRWQAFNIATGNNDGHNKNLALLREPTVRLAPHYDLVCTRAWDQLDKRLALRVGGARDAGAVGPRAWRAFAEAASLSVRAVLEEVRTLTEDIRRRAPDVAARAMAEGANSSAVRNALAHVEAHATRVQRLMEIESESIFRRARPRK